MRTGRWSPRFVPLVLALATLVLYAWRLGYSPIHLHYDEVFFGLQAHSIQASGRDLNGRLLPVYFQLENTFNWYQPLAVYWPAITLSIVPLSDAAIRLPTVLVAVANVVLVFFVGRGLTKSTSWGIVAAVLLMLTPAHFIHSRLAMDYVYPLPFILGWLLLMLRYLERRSRNTLFFATFCLGIGFFSYIAGTALTPLYLLATLAVIWWLRQPATQSAIAIAGFALPVAAAALFLALYPDTLPDLMQKYGLANRQAASAGLDPVQQLRELVNSRTISDALNHYWRFYSPGYLFVTGGANLTNSTRTTGVFLPPLAVLLVAGIVLAIRHGGVAFALLLFGFLTAPIPAAAMPEDFTIDRELALLPFAILLATLGAQGIWSARSAWRVRMLTTPLAAALAAGGIGYLALSLVTRGQLSSSAPLLLLAASAIYVTGALIDRSQSWRPVSAGLLLLVPLLFVPFLQDYFGEYRPRAAAWFGGNIRGAIEAVLRVDAESPGPEIHLSTDIPYMRNYWRFYLQMFERTDLLQKTKEFDGRSLNLEAVAPGSYVLSAGNDEAIQALADRGALTRVAGVTDPGHAEQFTIFRR